MAPVSKRAQFETLVAVLALVDERAPVSIDEAAAAVGMTPDALRPLLDQVLFLEFRDADDVLVSETDAFLLDEHGVLHLTEDHWLRDLAAVPPSAPTALRLLVAATVVRALVDGPSRALDTAMAKLERLVAADIVVPVDRPPQLDVCQRARREHRTLRTRYVKDAAADATDREIEPWTVFSNWGKWYVHGPDVGGDVAKWFRVDRMVTAEVGARTFTPPDDDVEIPDWFVLDEQARTVRVRIDPTALDWLPAPNEITVLGVAPAGDGRVDADVTVYGDRRLEHLLVVLPPSADVLAPAEHRDLRRAHAAALLERYE